MRRLIVLTSAAILLSAAASSSQAGLLDGLFERSTTTRKNPKVYGRIVSLQGEAGPALTGAQSELPPLPAGEEGTAEPAPAAEPISLFRHVKYDDVDEAHPCGVKMVVQVKDPCAPKPCGCCKPAPRCVFVEICVPPCHRCPKIEVSRDGSKVEYDYGEHEIEIVSKRGVVYVEYDD